jgi:NhaA family Na+:H+ antiporter
VVLMVIYLLTGVGWAAMADVGFLGGIGFTMALFIAMLAFGESPALDQAKVGVLSASVCAVIGYLLLRMTLSQARMVAQPEQASVTT